MEDDDQGPFSPRNEIEALRALELTVRGLRTSVGATNATAGPTLAKVHFLVLRRLNSFKSDVSSSPKGPAVGEADAELGSWAAKQGIKSLIQPTGEFCKVFSSGSPKNQLNPQDFALSFAHCKELIGLYSLSRGKLSEDCILDFKHCNTSFLYFDENDPVAPFVGDAIDFEGTGRGAAASTNIATGDLVLEIPQEVLISEDVALESDLVGCTPT